MKKRCLLLTLLLFLITLLTHSELLPSSYREAIQRQRNNKFNENEIISFVYRVYSMYDKHVSVERFLPLLSTTNLEMRFPEGSLHSHADFKRWYENIGKTVVSNVHTLESVRVKVLDSGRYQAEIVGIWQAESNRGEYITFKFRQQWTLLDGRGKQPLIQTYLVEKAQ